MKKITIFIILAVVVILGGIAFAFFYWFEGNLNINEKNSNQLNSNTTVVLNQNQNTNTTTQANTNSTNTNTVNENEEEKQEIKGLARTFAERFGSYSNKNNFEHLINLKPWMTETYWTYTNNYINQQKEALSGEDEYKAVTSKVISNSIKNYSDKTAKVSLLTQRIESDLNGNTTNYYQKLELEFKKVNENWSVNSATWGNKSDI